MFADITFESNEHIKSVISVLEDFCSPCPQFMENISLEFFCGIHLNFVYYMACVDRGMWGRILGLRLYKSWGTGFVEGAFFAFGGFEIVFLVTAVNVPATWVIWKWIQFLIKPKCFGDAWHFFSSGFYLYIKIKEKTLSLLTCVLSTKEYSMCNTNNM